MTWYRDKPIQNEIEARQVTADDVIEVAAWCGGQVVEEFNPLTDESHPGVNVPTLNGPMRASDGDYVVKEVGGRFGIYKKHQFEAKFEELYPS